MVPILRGGYKKKKRHRERKGDTIQQGREKRHKERKGDTIRQGREKQHRERKSDIIQQGREKVTHGREEKKIGKHALNTVSVD